MNPSSSIAGTQIGADGNRYPIGDPRLHERPDGRTRPQVVDPADDVAPTLPPGMLANPEPSGQELARVASGFPAPADAPPVDAAPISEQAEASGSNVVDTGNNPSTGASPAGESTEVAPDGEQPGATPTPPAEADPAGETEEPGESPDGADGGKSEPEFDIEAATKQELIDHAASFDPPIEVHGSKNKDEIREELKAGLAAR